ncbi:hypothetical protein P9D34_15310 [Bacillus swezeyi]|uniref:Spore coat protein n=1 Tax=Bacillus swezeyi TaxID=1925020 RepID=A0A1R1QNG1_9BACI|nr:hypothetical protein [Bacillus swezeyi]MEC1261801.1 hypothetical protein [Bacillus swezeyi]MED2926336.1 hypothetical protein [Bacillus swezeyi]MED2943806.1 hypothetical protein [Bacillus swezeyi]MED2966101.1 hypothetical protein [Bacillus swezeyi]MED2978730.1 hypothetical protein [Bacillus swezeyi]
MFRRKTGIHPAVLVLGSAALTAAFSPEIRKRVTSMISNRMGGQQHGNSQKNMMMNPAEMIKQAFNPGGQGQTQQQQGQSQSDHTGNQQQTFGHMSQAPVNVMNDETTQQTMYDADQTYS